MLYAETVKKDEPKDESSEYGGINPGRIRQSRRPERIKADHVRGKRGQSGAQGKQQHHHKMHATRHNQQRQGTETGRNAY